MNNAELLQQLAALNWVVRSGDPSTSNDVDEARRIYALIAGARVVDELYQRVTKKREIEAAWSSLVLRVADFVTKNPRANEKEQVEFVQKELKSFETYVESL